MFTNVHWEGFFLGWPTRTFPSTLEADWQQSGRHPAAPAAEMDAVPVTVSGLEMQSDWAQN